MTHPVLVVLAVLLLAGCQKQPTVTYGINPATMQCQVFQDGQFIGGFLPRNEFCPGEPTPLTLPSEDQQ